MVKVNEVDFVFDAMSLFLRIFIVYVTTSKVFMFDVKCIYKTQLDTKYNTKKTIGLKQANVTYDS